MRAWRRCLFGIGLVLGCSILLVVLLVFHHSAVPVAHADPAAAQQLQAKIEQAQRAAADGHKQVLSVNEAEINSLIDTQLAALAARNGGSRLRDLKVHLVNDRIGVHVALDAYGEIMTIDIAGTLRTRDGYIQFDPVSGKVGALPIPQAALKSAVQQALASPESRKDMRLPSTLSDLRVEDSKLVVTYE